MTACRPEEHCLLTACREEVSGRPARKLEILEVCAPAPG